MRPNLGFSIETRVIIHTGTKVNHPSPQFRYFEMKKNNTNSKK